MSVEDGHVGRIHTTVRDLGRRVQHGYREVEGVERVLWIVVALSLVGDVVTTFVGLHLGLAESNPVARSAIEGWGLVGMLVLKAWAVGIGLCCRPFLDPPYTAVIPAALALPWTIAVAVNLSLIASVL